MLDAVNPQAVAAFGSIAEHLPVVEAAAPRGIHVMVEKPLAFSVEDADKMEALAKRHGIHMLTNYGPPGTRAVHRFRTGARWQGGGADPKVVVRDGHFGPKRSESRPSFFPGSPTRHRTAAGR